MRRHFRVPPFAKNAKDGASTMPLMPAKSKPGPPAHPARKDGPPEQRQLYFAFMKSVALVCAAFVLASLSTIFAASQSSGIPPSPASAAAQAQGSGSGAANEDRSTRRERIGIAFASSTLSLIALGLSFFYFRRNRKLSKEIADRTVTIEAQKLLLEVNKQYVSDPRLFAIYDKYPKRDELFRKEPDVLEKVKALGYMKLNIFEVVYSVLPEGGAWQAYFEDSLEKCSLIREELTNQEKIYDKNLVAAYKRWKEKTEKAAAVSRVPHLSPPLRESLPWAKPKGEPERKSTRPL
jgi:hypothetical protein